MVPTDLKSKGRAGDNPEKAGTIAAVAFERDKASAQITGRINIWTSPLGPLMGGSDWLDITGNQKARRMSKNIKLAGGQQDGEEWECVL